MVSYNSVTNKYIALSVNHACYQGNNDSNGYIQFCELGVNLTSEYYMRNLHMFLIGQLIPSTYY